MTAKPEPITVAESDSETEAPNASSEGESPATGTAGTKPEGSPDQSEAPETTAQPPSESDVAASPETAVAKSETAAADEGDKAETADDTATEIATTEANEPGGETAGAEQDADEDSAQTEEESGELVASVDGGKIDPFVPLFRQEPEPAPEPEVEETAADSGPAIPAPPPRRKTPLEKLDLSQLKLVAIVRAPAGNKALVEEASGKGYIITNGTYIGINSGRVVDIQEDRVIVEEEEKDYQKNVTIRTRELKFQRPYGEE